MRTVMITNASVPAASPMSGTDRRRSASPPEKADAPTAPARKPRMVIAIWMVARKRLGSSVSRCAMRAAPLPSSASWRSRWRLTVIRAISLAAKKPPTRMRRATTPTSTKGLPEVLLPSIGRV
jgi:hypothetical protein